MIEFQNIVYMDLQKAATTSIVAFLRTALDEEEIKQEGAHRPAKNGHDTSKFHFISVREPINIYISLFGHGCRKLGGMYKGFRKRGLEHMYTPTVEGFEHWLEFVLDPRNARVVKKKTHGKLGLSQKCGLLTSRLIMLSTVDPLTAVKSLERQDRSDIVKFYNANRIYDYYVRTECLADDLFNVLDFCSNRIKLKEQLTTSEDLRKKIPRKNVGAKIDNLSSESISKELRDRVREYEWLFYSAFGYGENVKGRAPPLPPISMHGSLADSWAV